MAFDAYVAPLRSESAFRARAGVVYERYATRYRSRFRWMRAGVFKKQLVKDLRADAQALLDILRQVGVWNADADTKLDALHTLLTKTHSDEKVLIFSQFADTVRYLEAQLQARGMAQAAGVTGSDPDPTALAWRFSPVSNNRPPSVPPSGREDVGSSLVLPEGGKRGGAENGELRVLVATDVLSEGQNLQDAHIVVNYDLPWAIIRLIQRAGRVDRIGQRAAEILCYTFWPAEGVNRIIHLRERLRHRLRENAEVIGTDEAFFEDQAPAQPLLNLYNEQAGVLDDEQDTDIDLVSYAYQIWKNATDANPSLKRTIPKLPAVVYTTKSLPTLNVRRNVRSNDFSRSSPPVRRDDFSRYPPGVLVYVRTAEGNSALAWVDQHGQSVTESQFAVLRAAACALDTPALPRQAQHHELVQAAVAHITTERRTVGGQLGRPSGARYRTYTRLEHYSQTLRGTLLEDLPHTQMLFKAIEQLYHYPLREDAKLKLNRQIRSGVNNEQLAELVVTLYEENKLCFVQETQEEGGEAQIICSMGVVNDE
jgi:hypothetical protein